MIGITNEWAMITIEDNLETPRVPSTVQEWIEEEERTRNMINMQLAHEKSMIKSMRTANGSHMKICVKETSILMSSPRMVTSEVVQ